MMFHKGEDINAMKANNARLGQCKKVMKGFHLSTKHFYMTYASGLHTANTHITCIYA